MLTVPPEESPRALLKKAQSDRRTLERTVRKGTPGALRPDFDGVLAEAQRFTRMREYSKAMWILGQRRGRATYIALADGLVRDRALDQRDDMRYLFFSEVRDVTQGRPVRDLPDLVTQRRRQFEMAANYVLPDTWVGEPDVKRRRTRRRAEVLVGLGVSGGTATGRACIVMDALAEHEQLVEPGGILVAPFTDAPWTPLFIPAGAVVVETGGVLSHAATVAREFGIPCVVMVKDATRLIRHGQTITVDGTKGT